MYHGEADGTHVSLRSGPSAHCNTGLRTPDPALDVLECWELVGELGAARHSVLDDGAVQLVLEHVCELYEEGRWSIVLLKLYRRTVRKQAIQHHSSRLFLSQESFNLPTAESEQRRPCLLLPFPE